MWAMQDGTGSSVVRNTLSADGSDSPGALMTSLTAPVRAGTVE